MRVDIEIDKFAVDDSVRGGEGIEVGFIVARQEGRGGKGGGRVSSPL